MRTAFKYSVIAFIFLLFLLIINSCKKEELPTLATSAVTNITTISASSGGNITSDGGSEITERGVCWSVNTNPTTTDSKTNDGIGIGQFVSSLTGLTAGSVYHLRAYATNAVGTAYGADLLFTTLGKAPECLTQPATNISATGVTLNGTVDANDLPTTVTFEYGTTTNYGQTITATQSPVTGNSITNVSADITGLMAGTTYHFRVKTENSLGTTYGDDLVFSTLSVIPTVTTAEVTSITHNSALSGGNITSDGGTAIIARGVCWSISQAPTISDNKTSDGTGEGNFTSNLTGLSANTTYYVRAYATNSIGTAYGNETSFRTLFPNCGTVTDVDGNVYNTVTIGTQCWMAENLRTSKYNDGTNISYGWELDPNNNEWNLPTTPGYCWYDNDESYKIPNGALYNWLTVNTGKLCPTGWHVPTSTNWNTLKNYLMTNGQTFEDGSHDVAKSVASVSGWVTPQPEEYRGNLIPVIEGAVGKDQTTNNRTGFNAFPSGFRHFYDYFTDMGTMAIWWSATGPDNPWDFSITYNGFEINQGSDYKRNGFSVRCLKD